MKHVASFDSKANEQSSRLGSPRKLEDRTTNGGPFALAVLVLFVSRVLFGQINPFLGTSIDSAEGRESDCDGEF